MFKALRRGPLIALALLLPAMAAQAADPPLVRAQNSVRVLREIKKATDKAIPKDLLKNANAIAVIHYIDNN
jgi:lipid-binding SYLF domain-containing protein